MIWRDLKSLVQDPDTAKGPRMKLLEEAGFGQATGIRFESGVTTGFIIYFVQSDVDNDILNGVANVSYLRQCTQFIGSAVAMTEARRAIVGQLLLEKQLSITGVSDQLLLMMMTTRLISRQRNKQVLIRTIKLRKTTICFCSLSPNESVAEENKRWWTSNPSWIVFPTVIMDCVWSIYWIVSFVFVERILQDALR